jgi:hypothetical protein
VPVLQENTPHLITYVVSILTAAEMNKVVSKCITKTISFSLATDEPWDTMKAQLLAKICSKINPPTIDFSHYDILFFIPRVIPKPSFPLILETEYSLMLHIRKNLLF